MATKTRSAKAYEPTGDPEHVSYGEDFIWTCTCGRSANFITSESKAEYRAEHHEQHCTGSVTIDTVY